jgi:hypothetical protein
MNRTTTPWVATATLLSCFGPALSAQGFHCDYEPNQREVVLDTGFTMITPKNCPPVAVAGGVFVFGNVKIPAGVAVRGVGPNPMIWVVAGNFEVEGELSVSGEDGPHVNTLQSPNFPAPGGRGHCGGGNGGNGSPQVAQRSMFGASGFGPYQVPGFGGGGGMLSCVAGCGIGSGGGGGSFATAGDPYYLSKASGTSFVQQLGSGGFGCFGNSGTANRTLPGGAPGQMVFADGKPENDFLGLAYDVHGRRWIVGELTLLIGGAGGGGGGDLGTHCDALTNWTNDAKGAGGGGGGGALVIVALGKIRVGASGTIQANGGNGGGGEQAGSNNRGGGGGAGAGGMVLLYTLGEIELASRGETYINRDYAFSISADGGAGRQTNFEGHAIPHKYPIAAGFVLDNRPTGGMGGMGLVQLMAPPGFNQDGTNTVLDDSVHILRGTTRLTGREKQRYLAWRGFPNAQGVWVDDNGQQTNIGDAEGDIRPSPVLLPVF